jgi:hypothetical protein
MRSAVKLYGVGGTVHATTAVGTGGSGNTALLSLTLYPQAAAPAACGLCLVCPACV